MLGTHNAGELDRRRGEIREQEAPVICSGESVIVPEICKHDRCQLRLRQPLTALEHYRFYFY